MKVVLTEGKLYKTFKKYLDNELTNYTWERDVIGDTYLMDSEKHAYIEIDNMEKIYVYRDFYENILNFFPVSQEKLSEFFIKYFEDLFKTPFYLELHKSSRLIILDITRPLV